MEDFLDRLVSNARDGSGPCSGCPANRDGRSQRVNPGLLNPRAEVMFVTIEPSTAHTNLIDWEACSRWEDYNDEFEDRVLRDWDSGREIGRILEPLRPAVEPSDVWMADSIKCSPNGNSNRTRKKEFDHCRRYLREEIRELDPKVVVTLGKLPTERTLSALGEPMGDFSIRANAGRIIPTDPPIVVSTSWSYGNLDFPLKSIGEWGKGWIDDHPHLQGEDHIRIIDVVQASLSEVYTTTNEDSHEQTGIQATDEGPKDTTGVEATAGSTVEELLSAIDASEFRLKLDIGIRELSPDIDEDGRLRAIELDVDVGDGGTVLLQRSGTRDLWYEVEERTGISVSDGNVVLNRDHTVADNIQGFLEVLFDRGVISMDDIPIKLGRKRYLANTEPTNADGEKMVDPVKFREAVFVETDYSFVGASRRLEELADEMGILTRNK